MSKTYHEEFDTFLAKVTSLIRATRTAERCRIAALAREPWMDDDDLAEIAERASEVAQVLAAEENELGAMVLKLYQENDKLLQRCKELREYVEAVVVDTHTDEWAHELLEKKP